VGRRPLYSSRIILCLIGLLTAVSSSDQLHFTPVQRAVVEQRLRKYKGNDNDREATLKAIFETSGCSGDNLMEQPVKGLKQPNLICVLPGAEASSVIVVGAHYDHVSAGDGVVDNWSGASLLPSLYQALATEKRRRTFVFVSFAGEEQGLIGSRFYVRSLSGEDAEKIKAMVNMDTLGLGPAVVWASRSDKTLLGELNGVAHALHMTLKAVNVEKIGMSDEEPFIQQGVPVVIIHSLTQETLQVLHSPRDRYQAIRLDDYYASYRLISAYLAYIDQKAGTGNTDVPVDSAR
jgi:Zn-dependent M28 family amino/carboxypeptidase